MKANFKDYFNPFDFWTVYFDKKEVYGRNRQKYSLEQFYNKINNGFRLIATSEIEKFNNMYLGVSNENKN